MRQSVEELRELANNACRGISWQPERRGVELLTELENGLNEFLRQIPEELHDVYEKRYIDKYRTWLVAMSRTFSVMITGAAKFDNRKHDKMNMYERNARQRFTEWREAVLKRINKQSRLSGWAEVERLQNKLDTLKELQERMKAANKIVRSKKTQEEQAEELNALGVSEETIQELLNPPAYRTVGFAPCELSNNLAKIKATEEAIKRHTARAEAEDKEYTFDGGKVEICNSEERIRIYFDEIPDDNMRKTLKGNAFKWSPKNQAWQRQLTSNAIYALKKYVNLPNLKACEN
jgi:hypothetical protein